MEAMEVVKEKVDETRTKESEHMETEQGVAMDEEKKESEEH